MTLTAFTMPKWGIEMAEGTIAECRMAEGETISKGDVIAVIETDKIANEVEAEADARVYRVIMSEGDVLPVGALLAVTGEPGHGDAEVQKFINDFVPVDSSFDPDDGGEATVPPSPSPASAPEPAPAAPKVSLPDDANITPKARAYAEAQGVDISEIQPSTRRGRLTLQDVESHVRGARQLPAARPVDVAPAGGPMDSINATPGARKRAAELGVTIDEIDGTGRKGRVTRADIEAAARAAAPAAVSADGGHTDIPFNAMRRTVARRLVESKQTVPHYYLTVEVDMGRVFSLRETLKSRLKTVPSVNDFVIKAAATALTEVPDVNINVFDDFVRRFADANISVAVAVDGGLFTPVIRAADKKSIEQIAVEAKELAGKAREGKLLPEDYKGGTFSVSNLGMFGIDSFTAIINPPEGAILAVGAIQRLPREHNHGLWFASIMKCMMSCDHRAIDGALGAQFLKVFKETLENPARLVERL